MLKFKKSSTDQRVNFNQTWHKALWEEEDSSLFIQMKDDVLFKGEIITKIVEIYLPSLKIFFRTIGPLSTKLGTKHH